MMQQGRLLIHIFQNQKVQNLCRSVIPLQNQQILVQSIAWKVNKLLDWMRFLQFKLQNMMECNFCHLDTQENFIFTECSHLVCLPCASTKWDQRYSIKCCNKTTFLEEETCDALQKFNKGEKPPKKDQSKENINPPITHEKPQTLTIKTFAKDDYVQKPKQTQLQSIYTSEFDQKPSEKQNAYDNRQNEKCLNQLEQAMNQNVQRIKFTFEMYRKQLQRKEDYLLKEVYNRFSDQFAKQTVSEQETREFKEKVGRLIGEELSSLSKFTPKETEGKPDKILEKLEYNQLKMKEKLNRHYELLK